MSDEKKFLTETEIEELTNYMFVSPNTPLVNRYPIKISIEAIEFVPKYVKIIINDGYTCSEVEEKFIKAYIHNKLFNEFGLIVKYIDFDSYEILSHLPSHRYMKIRIPDELYFDFYIEKKDNCFTIEDNILGGINSFGLKKYIENFIYDEKTTNVNFKLDLRKEISLC